MPAIPAPKDLRAVEALMRERGFGHTLPKPAQPRHPPLPTGFADLDARLGGGFPRGAISEVIGPDSSGRTGLVLAALARATHAQAMTAYIDATDCLDPRSAERAGVVLERVLWVRCGSGGRISPARAREQAEQAWRAANLVVSAACFGVVAIDLGGLAAGELAAWRRPWLRLKQAVANTATVVAVLAERRLAGSAAEVALELDRAGTAWDGLLGPITVRAAILRTGERTAGSGAAREA